MSGLRSRPGIPTRAARPWMLPVAVLAAGVALASCQSVGADPTPPAAYGQMKAGLEAAYAGVEQAISTAPLEQVPAACDALSRELDKVEEGTKHWGILEREKLKLQIATARHALQAVVRAAPVSGDPQLLQDQLRPVGDAVREVTALLGQAAAPRSSP